MRLSIIFCCLFFVTFTVNAQEGYIEDFKKKWKNAAEYTLKVAELMPADQYDYKPSPDLNSFKELLLHMVGNMDWLSSSYLEGKKIDKDLKLTSYTKAEVIEILKEGFASSSASIQKLKKEDLNTEVEFFVKPMNKRQILTLMNDHLTHHRGQAITYLRIQGIKPPDYRGW